MLKKILLLLLAVVLLVVAYAAMQPSHYVIERSAVFEAPPSKVYPLVVDFHRWKDWSPWEKLDPGMKTEFTGPESGVGAVYAWKGNDKVGEGNMTVLAAVPDQSVEIRLAFVKPWEQVATTRITMVPDGAGTKVTWSMSGDHDLVGKVFAVFMNMDKAVGPDFERGLASLRKVATEARAP